MLSFRVDDHLAGATQAWSRRLGVERSELLRDALRQHLAKLDNEIDATTWEQVPLTDKEGSLAKIADWGVAEDWSDWADAAG